VDELELIGREGIAWLRGSEPVVTKVTTHAIVCDSPARCMVQGTHQFNGAFGCTWCLQEGEMVARRNGQARVYEYEVGVPKRTHQGVLESAQVAVRDHLDHHNGVKSASPLLGLPPACGVDVVRSFAVDYMHAVLLGIVRQMMELWFGQKSHGCDYSLRGSRDVVDARLLSIKPPHDISRTPRSLRASSHWKASECRNWLLYYSVPCLQGVMRGRYLKHWCLLVSSMYTLLQDDVRAVDVVRAEEALCKFSKDMNTLYEQENITFNIHASLHLRDCVRNLGSLWSCSTFPFEGFMMTIKKYINGTTRVPQQVTSRYLMSQSVKRHLNAPHCDGSVATLAKPWLNGRAPGDRAIRYVDGAVGLNASNTLPLTPAERRLLVDTGYDVTDGTTGQYVRRAIVGGSVCCTKQHGTAQKRNNFTLFTKYGLGRVDSICFLQVHDDMKCFLFLKKCRTLATVLSLKHAWSVEDTESLMLCQPADVLGNAVVTNIAVDDQLVCVCAKQPNKVEKD